MKLGLTVRPSQATGRMDMDLVLEAERLGFDAAWCGESYGTDSVTPIAWVLARTTRLKAGTGILQMSARTPACAAMTAMSLQALSGNRFLCGVGASGPQVVEGWHGQPYGKPLARTREYIGIIKAILAREKPLQHQGEHYQIPYAGPGATGFGKPLRSIIHGDPSLPVYTASIMPKGLALAGEIADGTLPIFMSPEAAGTVTGPIRDGMEKAGRGRDLQGFDVAPYVKIRIGPDLQACRDAVKPELALYIGGMGARGKNFYNDTIARFGYAEAAARIQDLYLDGQKDAAAAAVPDKLVDEIALVGPPDRVRDRLRAWQDVARDGSVGTLVLTGATTEALRLVAETVL